MLAERLLSVANILEAEFEEYEILKNLQKTVNLLSASVSQPSPQTGQAFKDDWNEFKTKLADCPSNSLVPSYRKILESIGGMEKTGTGLVKKIEHVLAEDRVTPASALSKIQELYKEVTKFHQTVSTIAAHLQEIGIEPESLPEGTDLPPNSWTPG